MANETLGLVSPQAFDSVLVQVNTESAYKRLHRRNEKSRTIQCRSLLLSLLSSRSGVW